ncbi:MULTISPECIES: alpha/beta hydrolase [Streptomycetaceae]|uniref:DUF1023 domain-containing protein n=1 Tax=Streptantibioticus cattleyicolor (strain ATCC 35852 / DSM 46488 / JCM 4925 / NBRC 14057 / NRRL 8057) TaxID=1003195 RepID=F8K2R9_STREN|nr:MULTISPECIES: alpha/beta hydrolase [Streptomycetaceae]AEW97583.1 protein of unknown function DUF1023 [Streptantibioticus cattleyicolor NRRL 8057 = DSM 46488]MYS62015.1 hypothetical protein [Streptomyces sp. SID5468]CCB77908.1 conserved exported protein of unknown function [Streptantibioticus cattleyicolor NRRL 8057 = DSM 46488]
MVSRSRGGRLGRALLAASVIGSVAVPVAGAARPSAVPAPAPAASPFVAAATPALLDARYAAGRQAVLDAERAATGHGDRARAAKLAAMAAPGRHFLSFDGRDGGRSVEVFGDLAHARRIAVLVPGTDTGIDTYQRFAADARALQGRLDAAGSGAAVVAWLGYRPPAMISLRVLGPAPARRAAPALRGFVGRLASVLPAARITVVCHSYGSLVCAQAADGIRAAAIVLFGSPGTGGTGRPHTTAQLWAGRSTGDWISGVPHVRLRLPFGTLGLGEDPMSPRFGARLFDAGHGSHAGYLRPGSPALENIARIVTGATPTAPTTGQARHA